MTYRTDTLDSEDSIQNKIHFILGKYMLATDIDFLEYHYENNQIKLDAVCDYKHGNLERYLQTPSLQAQLMVAEKLKLPAFLILYYLDLALYEVPMYYVDSLNDAASDYLRFSKGDWHTVLEFSQLLHKIRNLPFDPEERIPLRDNSGYPYYNPWSATHLKELPNTKKKYPLPKNLP